MTADGAPIAGVGAVGAQLRALRRAVKPPMLPTGCVSGGSLDGHQFQAKTTGLAAQRRGILTLTKSW